MISKFRMISHLFFTFLLITSVLLLWSSCNKTGEKSAKDADEIIAAIEEDEVVLAKNEEENREEAVGNGQEGMEAGTSKGNQKDISEQSRVNSTDNKASVQQKTAKEIGEVEKTAKTQEVVQEIVKEKEVVVKQQKEVIPTKSVDTPSDGWNIPSKYLSMKNPYQSNKDLSIGKTLYAKQCKSCHGSSGKGDGPKALSLDSKMRSFSSPEFKAQKPGIIYYKSYIGQNEMPNFEKKISDEEDRWLLINYMLSL